MGKSVAMKTEWFFAVCCGITGAECGVAIRGDPECSSEEKPLSGHLKEHQGRGITGPEGAANRQHPLDLRPAGPNLALPQPRLPPQHHLLTNQAVPPRTLPTVTLRRNLHLPAQRLHLDDHDVARHHLPH